MSVEAFSVDVRGVRTACRRDGEGEPLLYLHGAGLTGRWLPIHASLARHFDVVAPEHPGFGGTARPRWYRAMDDTVLHYADLLDALELETVHVVGHSYGGRLAGAFAAVFPKRVRSLTLLAPAPLDPGGAGDPEPEDEGIDIDALLFNGNQASFPEYLDGDDHGDLLEEDAAPDPHAAPETWSHDAPATLYRRLERVTCPSQVLVPDEDMLIPRELFDEWAAHLPGASVVPIPGRELPTSHLFIVQEHDAIAREVVRLAGEAQHAHEA